MKKSKSEQILPLNHKQYNSPSVFIPENLLREARRQKDLRVGEIPAVCILDPDGDIVHSLIKRKKAKRNPFWACYHTELYDFYHKGIKFGIVGCAVGSSFAVLVAEELFVSGCDILISITSSGIIGVLDPNIRFMLIEKAIRDEGTSYHYMRPSLFSNINKELLTNIKRFLPDIKTGISWTTDAPFRETKLAIQYAKSKGADIVEMEAAALYAFAEKKRKKIACLAHLTNQMGQVENDFEKGHENGSMDSLDIICRIAQTLQAEAD